MSDKSDKSDKSDDFNSDDWFDGLTDAEYAELRRITTPHERKTILACAEKEDAKCNNKIKNVLRELKRRNVDLDLIVKYSWQSLEDRRHYEKVAEFIDDIKREASGVKRTKGRTRKGKKSRGKRIRRNKSRRR